MEEFIKRAYDFHEKALLEFKQGNKKKDSILLRDACEKGWGAVVEATNALFAKINIKPLPKANKERRMAFYELEKRNGKISNLAISDRFNARCFKLHERGFYDGVLFPEEIEIELEKVREFIKIVEEI